MEGTSFEERLAWFKDNEKPEAVLLVADDPLKIKLLLAWTNTRASRLDTPAELRGDDESAVWQWLWDNTSFDHDELRANSAVSSPVFDREWRFLVGNRLVYPDGAVHGFVQRFLREKVLRLFDPKGERTARRAKAQG